MRIRLASCLLAIFYLLFAVTAFSQKKSNPKIGKNETEINLFNSWDKGSYYSRRRQVGFEAIYRMSWKKSTKLGGGVLLAVDQPEYFYEGNVKFYGTVFADIKQFIGKRQLLSIDGRIGHGLYKEEYEFDDSTSKGFSKWTAGMYYSIGPAYRIIVSKKILLTTSFFIFRRNFRGTFVADYYSPPSVERYKDVEHYSGMGLKFGVVF